MNDNTNTILCFGDSLTAGYGFTKEFSYPGVLQKLLDSKGYQYEVVNAGISGETTAGGLNRIKRVLNIKPDIFILELGINDGLRGLSVERMRENLQSIISIVKNQYPKVKLVLAGMQLPINLQNTYIRSFMETYSLLAKENNCTLIPFFLMDVLGVKSLNLPDGLHPNKEGYKIIANHVFDVITPLLEEPQN